MFYRSAPLSLALATLLSAPLAAQAAPPNLSDAEVAHVAVTANNIDVELGTVAETRAANAEVKRFAAMMVRDHSAVNEKAAALAGKLGVTPKDNAVSQSLLEGAKEAKAKVEPLSGAAFDRAYIEREIAYHQAVLDALDGVLVPTTQNGELKQLLVDVRPAFVAHLAYAKQVGQKLHASK
jgi:putative membrane protein